VKLELICDPDREHLSEPARVPGGRIMATNGFAAVVVAGDAPRAFPDTHLEVMARPAGVVSVSRLLAFAGSYDDPCPECGGETKPCGWCSGTGKAPVYECDGCGHACERCLNRAGPCHNCGGDGKIVGCARCDEEGKGGVWPVSVAGVLINRVLLARALAALEPDSSGDALLWGEPSDQGGLWIATAEGEMRLMPLKGEEPLQVFP
jgi:hypothetical protein